MQLFASLSNSFIDSQLLADERIILYRVETDGDDHDDN